MTACTDWNSSYLGGTVDGLIEAGLSLEAACPKGPGRDAVSAAPG